MLNSSYPKMTRRIGIVAAAKLALASWATMTSLALYTVPAQAEEQTQAQTQSQTQSQAPAADAELIRRGEYLARAGDCIACHTAAQGKPFAGGLAIPTPLGEIVSTNITPSKTHGIGNDTLAQFSAAVRQGIRADGAHLYPAMPYASYARLTDADVSALYAYFMSAVTPVDTSPRETALPFPFNVRMSMAIWNALFANDKPFVADPSKSVEWNRGAYLVRGLAHCSECHTPRNTLMGEDTSRSLGGAVVGTWYAPNISSDPTSGLGGWSEDQIAAYLRSGHVAGRAQAAGPMAEAIDDSLHALTNDDLRAMAVYLKSTPPVRNAGDTQPPYAWGEAKPAVDSIRGVPLPDDANLMTGAQLYDAHCAACHQANGEGVAEVPGGEGPGLPSLFHNTALGHANTNNLVMVMLEGVHRRDGTPDVLMPGFGHVLSDQQITTLANYLLGQYGNPSASVTVDQVRDLRRDAASGQGTSPLVTITRVGLAVIAVLVIALVAFGLRSKRSARRPLFTGTR